MKGTGKSVRIQMSGFDSLPVKWIATRRPHLNHSLTTVELHQRKFRIISVWFLAIQKLASDFYVIATQGLKLEV